VLLDELLMYGTITNIERTIIDKKN
jgi:hypothetical protein